VRDAEGLLETRVTAHILQSPAEVAAASIDAPEGL